LLKVNATNLKASRFPISPPSAAARANGYDGDPRQAETSQNDVAADGGGPPILVGWKTTLNNILPFEMWLMYGKWWLNNIQT
jgi:hypothetical protein